MSVWLLACNFSPLPKLVGQDANAPDACVGFLCGSAEAGSPADATDGTPDSPPDAQVCFGNAPFTICLVSPPTSPLTLGGTIDTSTSDQCVALASGGDYCVVAASTITVESDLRGIGTRPLVLIASDSITVSGSIDVGSKRGESASGAGAQPPTCNDGTPPGFSSATSTSGGGAGGSFVGKGGDGGAGGGFNSSNIGGAGGQAGDSVATAPITELRGGCSGQDGQGSGALKGAKGAAGGAVLLIAGTAIINSGTIKAGGAGGSGGGATGRGGGGGGGSGGMIVLDAPTITSTGAILANGGSGAEGSASQNSAGAPGADATTVAAAPGGDGNTDGGPGGSGSAGVAAGAGVSGRGGASNNNVNGRAGGGGGGGGAGLIKAPATAILGPNVSPSPVP